ncbi:glycine cleavage system T protein, partial [mine drainage metagenome]
KAQYTHLVDPSDGSVEDDLIVWWVAPSRFVVVANAANTALVRDTIGGIDATSLRALIAVQGPKSRELISRLSPEASELSGNEVRSLSLGGSPCVVAGTGYTGEDGVEIDVPADRAAHLFSQLVELGAVPAGLGARDTLRTEAGLPLFGHELGPGISPLAAGLDWVVGWNKESFRGRIPLVRERQHGSAMKLWGLAGYTRRPLRRGSTVHVSSEGSSAGLGSTAGAGSAHRQLDEVTLRSNEPADGSLVGDQGTGNEMTDREIRHEIGVVTSGGFGPSVGTGIGMALLSSNMDVYPGM